MPPKKVKARASGTPASAFFPRHHPGPVKGVDQILTEVLTNVIKRLNYPTLQMLRGTCKLFRDFLNEKEVHGVFMDLTLDKWNDGLCMDDDADFDERGGPCRCMFLVQDCTPGIDHVTQAPKKCNQCGRHYFEMLRPGVLVAGWKIWVEQYHSCEHEHEGEVSGKPLSICRDCWGLSKAQRSGKTKRATFCKRYGGWLRLAWLDSAGRSLEEKEDCCITAVMDRTDVNRATVIEALAKHQDVIGAGNTEAREKVVEDVINKLAKKAT